MSLPRVEGLSPEAAGTLRALLVQYGIDAAAVRGRTEGPGDLRNALVPTRAASISDDPVSRLVRLFFCGEAGKDDGLLPRGLVDAGVLVELEDGRIAAPFHLRIVRDLYLFSDYLGSDPEAVMGAGETTAVLYQAARPRERVGSVLDLGCGAGTLALLLARDAGRALGTDVNPRAVALARFNAAVNGLEDVEFRAGDLWCPVEGERFDLVVSQPPYYPIGVGAEPGRAHTFLHGGERGDELATRVMAGLPEHLSESGRGVVFTSWPADRELPESRDLRILELTTNRRELHGTRQSIDVVEHARAGGRWSAMREVPADAWGNVHGWRIDQMLASEDLLRGPAEALLARSLRLPRGATVIEEGGDLFLRCPQEALTGLADMDETTWRVIAAVDRGERLGVEALPIVREAVRRGLLV